MDRYNVSASHLLVRSIFRTWHVRLAVISFITQQFKLQYYISRGWMLFVGAVCKQASTQIWTWYVCRHRVCALGFVMQMLLVVQPYTVTIYCFTFTHSMECSILPEIFNRMWGCPLSYFLQILMKEKGEQQRKWSIYMHTLHTYTDLLIPWLYLISTPNNYKSAFYIICWALLEVTYLC